MTHPDTLQRAAFEAWHLEKYGHAIYSYNMLERWEGWQAALQAQPTSKPAIAWPEPKCLTCGCHSIDMAGNCDYCGAPYKAQPTPPVWQAAAEPVAINFELLRCAVRELRFVKFGFTQADYEKAMLDIAEMEFCTPQPTPDAEAMRLALEALKFRKCYSDEEGEICADAIAALEKVNHG